YLTIEHAGPIPLDLRKSIGNRIYGCDDCQLVCPWNKFARRSTLPDFDARDGLGGQALADLLDWTEAEFLQRTEGSPIRRIGHARWLRNVALAMGNALAGMSCGARSNEVTAQTAEIIRAALARRTGHASDVVREQVAWALAQHHLTI
ncbi:MAG: tRNA epoxyqueuosine(34) reductase QueG, partial [Pseudomonadota bacterium]